MEKENQGNNLLSQVHLQMAIKMVCMCMCVLNYKFVKKMT